MPHALCAFVYGPDITCNVLCTYPLGASICQVSSHQNIFQNFVSYIHNILFSTPTQTTGMITNYLYPIFVKLSVPAPTVVNGPWQKSFHRMIQFLISSVPSLNFQAFRLTIIISTGRVKFYYTCLVFQGDSGGPLVYLEKDGKYTLVGISSFVAANGCLPWPSGFTNVIRYLCWIAKHTGIFFCFCPWNLWHKEWAQKHSLIFLNQSYDLNTSIEEKVACNNFVI